jgi:hypothetical protein
MYLGDVPMGMECGISDGFKVVVPAYEDEKNEERRN